MKSKLIFYILIFDTVLFSGLLYYFDIKWYFSILPMLALLIFISIASFNIQLNFFLKSINSGNPTGNKIALTFDDGPHPIYTSYVLDLLKKYNAQVTFFCIGQNIRQYPHILSRIHNEGHTIGNHSFSHSKTIDFNNTQNWLKEIKNTDSEVFKIIGKKPRFFRPPFGVTTPHLSKAIKETNHTVIGWSIRSFDTVPNNTPEKVVQRILKKVKSGSIILLHDHLPNIIPILEQLLPELQKRNFTFATVDELINSDSYEQI